MTKFIFALGIVLAMGVIVMFIPNTTEVINHRPETIIQVETVDTLEDRIKTAQEAEMSQIEASAQEAYNAYVEGELKRIEDEVKIEYIKEIEQTIDDPAY